MFKRASEHPENKLHVLVQDRKDEEQLKHRGTYRIPHILSVIIINNLCVSAARKRTWR